MTHSEMLRSLPQPLTGVALRDYFLDHVADKSDTDYGFFELSKDLPVFKKVLLNDGIGLANLVVPAGATVYAPSRCWYEPTRDSRKMRASKARVHSIVSPATFRRRKVAVSSWDEGFKYRDGAVVTPARGFSMVRVQCAGGIHFFLNAHDAYHYF